MHGECSHEISVIDPVKKEVVDVIDTRPVLSPHGMWLDESRDLLWVSYEGCEDGKGEGGLVAVSLETRNIVKRVGSGTKTHVSLFIDRN